MIPKYHAQFLHEIPDEYLSDILPVAKKIASALNVANYNILQNNGRLAHQAVDHVHFHIMYKLFIFSPKDEMGGLELDWQVKEFAKENLGQLAQALIEKLNAL